MSDPITKPARFVWPPRPPVEVVTADPSGAPEPRPTPATRHAPVEPSLPGWRAALREIERTWLGLTVPPLPQRLAEARWTPDEPAAYCTRCARTTGPHEADASGCSVCRGRRFPWGRIVRLGEYRGVMRQIVHDIKFTRWRRLGDDMGRMLGTELSRQLEDAGVDPASVLLVPVPTSWRRRISRGIDHPLVIARGAAPVLNCEVAQFLTRTHRPSQTQVPVSRRRENVEGSIRARLGVTVPSGAHLVVIDDVTTTRATLRAACRALRSRHEGLGPSTIWGAVLSVTPEPSTRQKQPESGLV